MPMTAAGLSAEIKGVIADIPEDERNFDAMWDAIAEAIIAYFKANATITIQAGSVATGVVPGAGTAPVTGTCSIA